MLLFIFFYLLTFFIIFFFFSLKFAILYLFCTRMIDFPVVFLCFSILLIVSCMSVKCIWPIYFFSLLFVIPHLSYLHAAYLPSSYSRTLIKSPHHFSVQSKLYIYFYYVPRYKFFVFVSVNVPFILLILFLCCFFSFSASLHLSVTCLVLTCWRSYFLTYAHLLPLTCRAVLSDLTHLQNAAPFLPSLHTLLALPVYTCFTWMHFSPPPSLLLPFPSFPTRNSNTNFFFFFLPYMPSLRYLCLPVTPGCSFLPSSLLTFPSPPLTLPSSPTSNYIFTIF